MGAPALVSLEPSGCVLHNGSPSKTISLALRLSGMVAPQQLAERFDYWVSTPVEVGLALLLRSISIRQDLG